MLHQVSSSVIQVIPQDTKFSTLQITKLFFQETLNSSNQTQVILSALITIQMFQILFQTMKLEGIILVLISITTVIIQTSFQIIIITTLIYQIQYISINKILKIVIKIQK